MHRLAILLLLIAAACTQGEQPAAVLPGEDIAALRKQIAVREQKINDTAIAKDTAMLLELYRQQADDNRKVGDWDQFARYYTKRYELAADSSHSFLVSCLDSIIAYEDALAKTAALRSRLADAYFNRAYEFDRVQRYAAEVADGEKYLQYAGDSAPPEYLQFIYNNTGNAWARIGDKQQAIFCLEKALYWVKKTNSTDDLSVTYINLVNSYQVFNEIGKAGPSIQAGLSIRNIPLKREAYLNGVLAELYNSEQKNAEALKYIDIALRLIDQWEPLTPTDSLDKHDRTATLCLVKSEVLFSGGQFEPAKDYCLRAIKTRALYDPNLHGRQAGKAFNFLGKLYMRSGQTDSALYCYDRALKTVFKDTVTGLNHLPAEKDLLHENTIMEALDAASEAYIDNYRQTLDASALQRSLNCINLAFKTEELIRQLYIYDNSKYNQGNQSKSRSQRGIEASTLLWGATGKDKWLDEAFMYAEKSRANVLMDKMKENLLSGLSNDSSFAETRQLWFKIQSINDQVNELERDTSNAAAMQVLVKEKEQLEARFSRNKNRVNILLQKMYKENPLVTVAEIRQKLLRENDAIIEYFAGDSLLYRFVLQEGKNKVEMTTVPLKTVSTLVQSLTPYLTDKNKYNNDPAAYAKLAAKLYEQVFPSLPVTAKKIVVIADGLLQFFPFEALMTNTATPSFLVQHFRFTAAFSCASLLQQMSMANGIFDADGIAFAPFINNAKDDLPALPQSGAEAESVRNAGDVVAIFKNENATSKKFMEQAGKGKILHLASHAFADGSDSVQPRIEFADGSLSLEKIYALQLNNRLVVLSACQTGIGKLDTAEGALSLARGFYYSGAKNVINSLWEVDDQSAAQIFGKFYRHLKKTGSIDRSLALARQEYIMEAPVEKRSPYYWASFVCIGDGVYEQPKDNTRLILICVGGLLGLVILMILFRRSSRR